MRPFKYTRASDAGAAALAQADAAAPSTGARVLRGSVYRVVHADGSKDTIMANHTYNDAQIKWFKEGSALNLIKKENA